MQRNYIALAGPVGRQSRSFPVSATSSLANTTPLPVSTSLTLSESDFVAAGQDPLPLLQPLSSNFVVNGLSFEAVDSSSHFDGGRDELVSVCSRGLTMDLPLPATADYQPFQDGQSASELAEISPVELTPSSTDDSAADLVFVNGEIDFKNIVEQPLDSIDLPDSLLGNYEPRIPSFANRFDFSADTTVCQCLTSSSEKELLSQNCAHIISDCVAPVSSSFSSSSSVSPAIVDNGHFLKPIVASPVTSAATNSLGYRPGSATACLPVNPARVKHEFGQHSEFRTRLGPGASPITTMAPFNAGGCVHSVGSSGSDVSPLPIPVEPFPSPAAISPFSTPSTDTAVQLFTEVSGSNCQNSAGSDGAVASSMEFISTTPQSFYPPFHRSRFVDSPTATAPPPPPQPLPPPPPPPSSSSSSSLLSSSISHQHLSFTASSASSSSSSSSPSSSSLMRTSLTTPAPKKLRRSSAAKDPSVASSSSTSDGVYFWEYNVYSKGPKVKDELEFDAVLPKTALKSIDDCLADEALRRKRPRMNQTNDLTPDLQHLNGLGQKIRQLEDSMNNVQCENESEMKREKNCLASKVCRLKRKAHHEANKILLDALQKEQQTLERYLAELVKLVGTDRWKQPAGVEQLVGEINLLKRKRLFKSRCAGMGSQYVFKLLQEFSKE